MTSMRSFPSVQCSAPVTSYHVECISYSVYQSCYCSLEKYMASSNINRTDQSTLAAAMSDLSAGQGVVSVGQHNRLLTKLTKRN